MCMKSSPPSRDRFKMGNIKFNDSRRLIYTVYNTYLCFDESRVLQYFYIPRREQPRWNLNADVVTKYKNRSQAACFGSYNIAY